MRKYFSEKNQKKLFVAYNTLNFTDIDKETVPDKEITKKKYGISENKVILYISRMMPYKRVDALGADTYVINNKPNGLNINNNAGSTHIEGLQKFVVENGLDVGFAFDGDSGA